MGSFLRCVRLAAHVSFARHGRALAGESPEHVQVVSDTSLPQNLLKEQSWTQE